MSYTFASRIYKQLLKGERLIEVNLSEKSAFNIWLLSLTGINELTEDEKKRLTIFNPTRIVYRPNGWKIGQRAVEFSHGLFSRVPTKFEDYKEPHFERFEKKNFGGGLRTFMVVMRADKNAVEIRMIMNEDVVIRRETGEIVK